MPTTEADLGKREYEGPDPQASKGEATHGTGDSAMDLAYQMLQGAKTAEDVAAAMKFAPGYVRAIVLVAQKRFGNAVVEQAMYLSQTADHTAGVANRDALSTGAANATDTTAVAANGKLPFTTDGWDPLAINKALGQYDRITGTDSDGARCAFAVALAAHVFKGPSATVSYALNYVDQTKARITAKGEKLSARQEAAIGVVGKATNAIASKDATYGDLSWLQEGLHDLTLDDEKGAASSAFALQDSDVTKKEQLMSVTCMSAADVIKNTASLDVGEQYMCEWVFPKANSGKKDSEGQGKHEMLIVNQDGQRYLYDSERQGDGAHLRALDAAALEKYFQIDGSWITLSIKLFPAEKAAEKPAAAAPGKPGKKKS
jgi:hypothetical protein